jgi:phenylacetate-CoA ligase
MRKPRNEILNIQWKLLKETIHYAYKNVQIYRERFSEMGVTPEDIQSPVDMLKLPTISKSDLQGERVKKLISKEFVFDELVPMKTSGSTGMPTVSYFSKESLFYLKWILKYRSKAFYGLRPFDTIAIFCTDPEDEVQRKNRHPIRQILNIKYISIYAHLKNIEKEFLKIKPRIIYGFPSFLINFIYHLEKNGIRYDYCKMVFTSSELLDGLQRKIIENFLSCHLYDIYGSVEFKEVAFECRQRKGYHINADFFYVEFIKNGRYAALEEDAEMLVTSLQANAMPLLRYEIGDIARLSSKICSCGCNFPLITMVCGRKGDFLSFHGKTIPYYEINRTLREALKDTIYKFQFIQLTQNKVNVKLIINYKYSDSVKYRLIDSLKKQIGMDTEIKITLEQEIKNQNNGKFCSVQSLLNCPKTDLS